MQAIAKWNATDYNQNSANQQRWARELIAKLELKGNERILDIGCGDGKITTEIASYLPTGSILGIDSSLAMIEFARSKFPRSDFPNLTFQQQDATCLNFDNEFDLIVSFNCLHWIFDHFPVLQGIKKSLKPSGKVGLQFAGKSNATSLRNIIEQVIYSAKWQDYFQNFTWQTRAYSDTEYRDLLKRMGLKANRVELVRKVAIHQGKIGLKAWIRTTGTANYLNQVPPNLHQEIIDEIVDTYLESYTLDDTDCLHISMVMLEVEATKES